MLIQLGGSRLLDNPIAKRLLTSAELARVALGSFSQRRYYGDVQAATSTEQVTQSDAAMALIVLRSAWAGVSGFQRRARRARVAAGLAPGDGTWAATF